MFRRAAKLSKKSLVVDGRALREWMKLAGYRTESEAVRAAVARSLAIRKMQEAIARIHRGGTFGRHLL